MTTHKSQIRQTATVSRAEDPNVSCIKPGKHRLKTCSLIAVYSTLKNQPFSKRRWSRVRQVIPSAFRTVFLWRTTNEYQSILIFAPNEWAILPSRNIYSLQRNHVAKLLGSELLHCIQNIIRRWYEGTVAIKDRRIVRLFWLSAIHNRIYVKSLNWYTWTRPMFHWIHAFWWFSCCIVFLSYTKYLPITFAIALGI